MTAKPDRTQAAPIPLAVPSLGGNEARYLLECVETAYVSSIGPFVARFERMVAEAAGAREAVATASGTVGLHLALTAVGVGRDDLVVVPSLTFIATANAVSQCGAGPWLFDVDKESWSLDPALLDRSLATETERRNGRLIHRASGRRVAAIMPVHALGLPADMEPIVAAAARHGLPVVADGAAALGATYKQCKSGALGAQLTVYSFNGNKTATAGGGGAVAGDDQVLIGLARHLSTTARVGEEYEHDRAGFNYRMTNLQAAVGCAQLERLGELVAAKRRIARRYDAAFADIAGIGRFPAPTWAESACWLSGLVIDERRADRVPAIRAALHAASIDARPFWKPMHLQPPYRDAPRTDMKLCDGLWRRVLTLPCSTSLTERDQDRVIRATRAALAA